MPSWLPMSCSEQMCGWFSAATARASRSKRSRDCRSVAMWRQHLDRNGAIEAHVARLVDFTHRASALAPSSRNVRAGQPSPIMGGRYPDN